jgi:hypothetical protein
MVLLVACGCDFYSPGPPCSRSIGARQMSGYVLERGGEVPIDARYSGFLVGTDKPGHFSVGWIDALGAPTLFSGTVSADGAIDPQATFAHTREENLTFDSAQQISFHSAPGADLHGVDLTTASDVIYLDGYVNGAHLGATASVDGVCVGLVDVMPVAFTGTR